MTDTKCRITGLLFKLELLKRIILRRSCRGLGLHFKQRPMLDYILRHDGCTQTELARALHVTPASVATSTKRLQHSGFITKQTDECNLRQNRISVTEKGRAAVEVAHEHFVKLQTDMLRGFSDSEAEVLASMLERMAENIADEETGELNIKELILIDTKLESEKGEI